MNATFASAGIIGLFVFVFQVWVLLKALSYPAHAWQDAHVSRGLWIGLLVLAFFLSVCGLFITLFFWLSTSTAIRRQMQIGRPGFPGTT